MKLKMRISLFLFALGLSSAAAYAVDDAEHCRYECKWAQNQCVRAGGSNDACAREYDTCFMECMHI